ncbi:MAG: hypothetical protein SGILL_009479, partial [Bacillariaceae sp.]
PLGDRKALYHDFMNACREKHQEKCDEYEEYRIQTNLQQPRSMVNYTSDGFKVIKGSQEFPQVSSLLQEFWSHHREQWTPEQWPPGNTYVNHWASPTFMVSVDQYSGLRRNSKTEFQQLLWDAATTAVSTWIPQVEEWTECSMYGIRVYTDGAMLLPHVDQLPQVVSIVINVAQDTIQPWPLEIYSHKDGEAYNVTLEPGDWLLYESHSIIHGRPFALKGNYYANLFLHLEPKGHSKTHHNHESDDSNNENTHKQYKKAVQQGSGGHETMDGGGELPPYILPNSAAAETYQQEHSNSAQDMYNPTIHDFAANGKLTELVDLIERNQRHLVNSKDKNGWTPLHEGARGGYMDVVRYLVERGADVNERSHGGTGGNALFYATQKYGEKHPVAEYLVGLGVKNVAPDEEL